MERNKLATQTWRERLNAYRRDAASGAKAYKRDGTTCSLATLPVSDVEFIGGLWRVQERLKLPIQRVRDRDFVLGDRINRTEKNQFEYFNAYMVGYNCYGPFIGEKPSFIVGRFSGGKNTFWAYGTNIPAVRSFLAIALFDRYSDMIFAQENIRPTR